MSAGVRRSLSLTLEAVGFWAPQLPDWQAARGAFAGGPMPAETSAMPRRPAPDLLPPAERRRAPDSVALALEVAAQAVAAAGRDPAVLPSVFTSAYGDLALLDQLCTTLVTQPTLLSPTRFHNSVHNAASGYWTIATGCRAASTAVSAHRHSFAAGLLEAATQVLADETPVLLVAADAPAAGALASVARSDGLLGVAMVLSPPDAVSPQAPRPWQLQVGIDAAGEAPALRSAAAQALQHNAMADALPLLERLAMPAGAGHPADPVVLPLSSTCSLRVAVAPF